MKGVTPSRGEALYVRIQNILFLGQTALCKPTTTNDTLNIFLQSYVYNVLLEMATEMPI